MGIGYTTYNGYETGARDYNSFDEDIRNRTTGICKIDLQEWIGTHRFF